MYVCFKIKFIFKFTLSKLIFKYDLIFLLFEIKPLINDFDILCRVFVCTYKRLVEADNIYYYIDFTLLAMLLEYNATNCCDKLVRKVISSLRYT